jgi:hypothetical protein
MQSFVNQGGEKQLFELKKMMIPTPAHTITEPDDALFAAFAEPPKEPSMQCDDTRIKATPSQTSCFPKPANIHELEAPLAAEAGNGLPAAPPRISILLSAPIPWHQLPPPWLTGSEQWYESPIETDSPGMSSSNSQPARNPSGRSTPHYPALTRHTSSTSSSSTYRSFDGNTFYEPVKQTGVEALDSSSSNIEDTANLSPLTAVSPQAMRQIPWANLSRRTTFTAFSQSTTLMLVLLQKRKIIY